MFDKAQAQISLDRTGHSVVLAYLVANLTRWTTHCVAFIRLLRVSDALKLEVMQHRSGLIKAQVGAATERACRFCCIHAVSGFNWSVRRLERRASRIRNFDGESVAVTALHSYLIVANRKRIQLQSGQHLKAYLKLQNWRNLQ
jgi:hypothetical protein